MDKDKVLNVLYNLKDHIIYDKNIQQICYSSEFVKAKKEIIDLLRR